jgi:hypothetical protein
MGCCPAGRSAAARGAPRLLAQRQAGRPALHAPAESLRAQHAPGSNGLQEAARGADRCAAPCRRHDANKDGKL